MTSLNPGQFEYFDRGCPAPISLLSGGKVQVINHALSSIPRGPGAASGTFSLGTDELIDLRKIRGGLV
jgi:hypothetical protein